MARNSRRNHVGETPVPVEQESHVKRSRDTFKNRRKRMNRNEYYRSASVEPQLDELADLSMEGNIDLFRALPFLRLAELPVTRDFG